MLPILDAVGLSVLVAVAAMTPPASAQSPSPPACACRFIKIPMRDSVRLNTSVCEPGGAHDSIPILLTRTPYGIAGDTVGDDDYRFFAADGYIFVYQDIRGRFGSEGQFIMNRPLHDPADGDGVDESTDAYDTVEWLVHNLPSNNGRVGVLGVSYPGFLATMAGIDPHPAVRAVSPQAPMTDTWMGDDFFHQGAFRLSYGFEYVGSMERYFHGRVPTWEAFVAHPAYDAHWKARAVQRRLESPAVPTLVVGGWWDQEDRFGPLATYRALERGDSGQRNFLVIGPWNHGGWRRESRKMPVVDPGTSVGYLRDVEAPWFAYWLKDKGKLAEPEAYVYDAGAGGRPVRPVRLRPRASRPVPAEADRADLRPARLALADVGDAGPAVRGWASRRRELGVGAADRRRAHRRRGPRRSLPRPPAATPTGP